MIKAVLFDLDGTLVNSVEDLADSVNYALNKFGYPTHDVAKYNYFAGNGIPKMIERALPENQRTKEIINQLKDVFLNRYGNHFADKTYAYKDMPMLISALKSQGIKVAVITNKAQEMAYKVVNKLYGNSFNIIMGKQDDLPLKPDPKSTLLVMENLNVKPTECIFLGDSSVDVLTGINSGAVSIGETWGFRTKDELTQVGADYIIDSPLELLDIISKINNK